MKHTAKISKIPGNTPIKHIPYDYYPKNCEFWFKILNGLDKNKKLFFFDYSSDNVNPIDTIVFVHGNPECSYSYRKIIKYLIKSVAKPFRIVAMDHIGFGLSNQASYEMVCMDHANNLLQLIRYLDLWDVTLVVHDWGGPIGIGAFIKEPKRVSNLIILNSTVFPLQTTGITYKNYPSSWLNWAMGPYIIPNRLWGNFASFVIFLKPSSSFKILVKMLQHIIMVELGRYNASEKDAQRVFKEQFKSKLNVNSSKRLVLQTKKWGFGNTYKEPKIGERDTKDFYRFIQDNITDLWGPKGQNIGVRALFGGWDPLAKNEVIKQWIKKLPQLKGHIKVFKGLGHFIEEIKPKQIAKAIMEVTGLI